MYILHLYYMCRNTCVILPVIRYISYTCITYAEHVYYTCICHIYNTPVFLHLQMPHMNYRCSITGHVMAGRKLAPLTLLWKSVFILHDIYSDPQHGAFKLQFLYAICYMLSLISQYGSPTYDETLVGNLEIPFSHCNV